MSYSIELIPSFINPNNLTEPFTLDKYDSLQLNNVKQRLQVFSDIQTRLSGRHKARIQDIKERLENINNRLHNLKIVVTQTSSEILSSNKPFPISNELSTKKWCQPESCVSLIELFSPESSHSTRVLEECEPELDFSQFDKFRKDGVKSKSLYSNPEFFLQEYMSTAEIVKKKKPAKKVVKKLAQPVHTKPISKSTEKEETTLREPPRKDSIPLPPDLETNSSIPPPPLTRKPGIAEPKGLVPPPPVGMPPGLSFPSSPPSIDSRSSIPPPPPLGDSQRLITPPVIPSLPGQGQRKKSSISDTVPELPSLSPSQITPPDVEHDIPKPPSLPTSPTIPGQHIEETESHPAPDMPSLDKDDEEDKQQREGAINNLLEEIKKQKKKQRKVKTVHDDEKTYENPFEAAIRNVNRSKLRKVKTKDESKLDNKDSDFTTTQSKGLFDVLALRTAMHEESEEEVVADDEDWT